MKKYLIPLSFLVFALGPCIVRGETNEVDGLVKDALIRTMMYYGREAREIPRGSSVGETPRTWDGFWGGFFGTGQTLSEKQSSFDAYLSRLGTEDLVHSSSLEQRLVRTAITQCMTLGYTNSVEHLKGLVLNTNGVHRSIALLGVLNLCPLDNSSTDFVVSVMTNKVLFGLSDRGRASCLYANRLVKEIDGDVRLCEVRERAARIFYGLCEVDVLQNSIIDDLFVKGISGYASSSNRLMFAIRSLHEVETIDEERAVFTTITNQLLSSGHPLRQLTIGEEGNE